MTTLAKVRPSIPAQRDFASFGQFCRTVRKSSHPGKEIDRRLIEMRAPATVGTSGVGADGGFAIPQSLGSEIEVKIFEDSLLPLCDVRTISRSVFPYPVDDLEPWNSAGIQAVATGENVQGTQDKPTLETRNLHLNKLMGLVPITDELLEDSTLLGAYLTRKIGAVVSYSLNRQILVGTGVGEMLGCLTGPSVVSVAKEGSQSANTVVKENLAKMLGRLTATSRKSAVWVAHPDAAMAINDLVIQRGGVSGVDPFGLPLHTSEALAIIGDVNDVALVDLSQYLIVQRAMKIVESIHLWFDYDVSCFRWVLRINGLPWQASPVTSRVGGNTRSPFVILAERA